MITRAQYETAVKNLQTLSEDHAKSDEDIGIIGIYVEQLDPQDKFEYQQLLYDRMPTPESLTRRGKLGWQVVYLIEMTEGRFKVMFMRRLI